jgi:hypothetical protein
MNSKFKVGDVVRLTEIYHTLYPNSELQYVPDFDILEVEERNGSFIYKLEVPANGYLDYEYIWERFLEK